MKNKEKAYSIALASTAMILFLMLVSSVASAATEQNSRTVAPPEIISGAGDFSDDKVVLNELSTEGIGTAPESIPVTAASNITETQITTNASDQYSPKIYGNRIVWEDYRNGNLDIYMYDLSTKKETQITTNISDQWAPAIYGNRIVWTDYRNGNANIYMYDISTSKETRITTYAFGSWNPAIYGDKIVWTDERNGNADIYMYDLSTSKETQITTNKSEQYNPAIYDNRIVWEDYRDVSEENWNLNIYMYDLSTNKETQITNNPSASYSPKIYGDRIVWYDDRNGNWDIYVYDLVTGQETHTTDKSDQYSPNIYGNKIVWTDYRNRNTDVYMGSYSSAAFSAKPIEGTSPLNVTFTDKSAGTPTSWNWDFGDGTSSTVKNPTHQYSSIGRYTVSLTATNADGSNTLTKTDYIKVVAKPVAVFSASPTAVKTNLNVSFTDQSTGVPTSWKWTFGDGTSSSDQNPIHQYSKEGTYTVKMTVKNVAGSNTITKTNYITVTTNTRPGIYSEK
jgi:beta propeller repeat protein